MQRAEMVWGHLMDEVCSSGELKTENENEKKIMEHQMVERKRPQEMKQPNEMPLLIAAAVMGSCLSLSLLLQSS